MDQAGHVSRRQDIRLGNAKGDAAQGGGLVCAEWARSKKVSGSASRKGGQANAEPAAGLMSPPTHGVRRIANGQPTRPLRVKIVSWGRDDSGPGPFSRCRGRRVRLRTEIIASVESAPLAAHAGVQTGPVGGGTKCASTPRIKLRKAWKSAACPWRAGRAYGTPQPFAAAGVVAARRTGCQPPAALLSPSVAPASDGHFFGDQNATLPGRLFKFEQTGDSKAVNLAHPGDAWRPACKTTDGRCPRMIGHCSPTKERRQSTHTSRKSWRGRISRAAPSARRSLTTRRLLRGFHDPDDAAAAHAPPLPFPPEMTRFTISRSWACMKGFSSRGTPRAVSAGNSS
jgi:hypothetical protein